MELNTTIAVCILILPVWAIQMIFYVTTPMDRYPARVLFKSMTLIPILFIPLFAGQYSIYTFLIVAGLACSLVGDILMVFRFKHPDFFISGGIAFAVAHFLYIAALTLICGWNDIQWVLLIVALSLAAFVVLFIKPKKKKMLIMLSAYSLVVSLMLWRAVSLMFTDLDIVFRILVASGAALFWISDFQLAYNAFKKPMRNWLLWNSILYFSGQFLIALSAVAFH